MMGKMKIEIRKPQHMMPKEPMSRDQSVAVTAGDKPQGVPFFFNFLLLVSYVLCGVAIWFAMRIFLER
ncbi:MAG TPA: hypothetical protein PK590_03800 [Candidatus Omnitrophota bacterium]|nr:hypothetical protein [Candidatus Omnitrophota bacterium]HPW76417.1 hypothetical protein [Candidatus Omnitrophota bacterium]HQB11568.1 hypothetical protein [Candidatus Omnitrophota bacterium]